MCGTADWEWEQNKFAYSPEDKFCIGCNMRHNASEDKKSLPGTTVILAKKTKRQKAQEFVRAKKKAQRDRKDRLSEET